MRAWICSHENWDFFKYWSRGKLSFRGKDVFLCLTNRFWLYSIALILFILSIGMFSFWESIAAQFQTFVLHGEQTLLKKDSPSSRTTKSQFFRRSTDFGNVSFFSGRGNKHNFRAYPTTLKIAELCFETKASHSTIIWSTWLFWLSPSFTSRHRLCQWHTSTSTFLIFQKTLHCMG